MPSKTDDSNRSVKRQRSVKDLVQQAQELSQKKALIDQLLQKRIEQERLQNEKTLLLNEQQQQQGNNMMATTSSTTTTTSAATSNNQNAFSNNISISLSAEDYKKKMEQYTLQQQQQQQQQQQNSMNISEATTGSAGNKSRLESLREENERIKKLLEEQAKQQEE